MNKFFHFFQYHNAIPVALGLVFLGGTGVFAATDPGAIYSAQQTVISVDNTYIVGKELSSYTPRIVIAGVTEDVDNYYVAYDFYTIDVSDSVWKDLVKNDILKVAKNVLGHYGDLGVYATEQFKQLVGHEKERLAEAQSIERGHVSQKMVATQYSGLIGKMLDGTTETLPGYTPVVSPPQPDLSQNSPVAQTAGAAAALSGKGSGSVGTILQILGNNPAYIPLKASYVDLGVVIVDQAYVNFGVHSFVNGSEVQNIQLDTGTTSETTIRYTVRTGSGDVGDVTRRVIVYDPANPPVFETQVSQSPPVPPLSLPEPVIQTVLETPPVSPSSETTLNGDENSDTASSTSVVPAANATSTDETATSSTP